MTKHDKVHDHEHVAPVPAPVARTTIKIQGYLFEILQPFAEGPTVLTAGQAGALNQTRAENIRNNGASWLIRRLKAHNDALIAKGLEPLTEDDDAPEEILAEFRAYVAELDATYDFSARRTRAPADPVEREAYKIAASKIREKLVENKIEIKSLADGQFEALVNKLLEARPEIREVARRRVEEAAAIASVTLDELRLDA